MLCSPRLFACFHCLFLGALKRCDWLARHFLLAPVVLSGDKVQFGSGIRKNNCENQKLVKLRLESHTGLDLSRSDLVVVM